MKYVAAAFPSLALMLTCECCSICYTGELYKENEYNRNRIKQDLSVLSGVFVAKLHIPVDIYLTFSFVIVGKTHLKLIMLTTLQFH